MTDLNPVDAMTTNPYRAMCAELVDAYVRGNNLAESIFRARTLLDQPVAEGTKPVVDYIRVPEIATESQIRSAAQYLVKKQNCDGDLIPAIKYAIARWGRPTPQPVPVSERLPEPNDCNDEGYCWWWRTDEVGEWWEFLYLRDARDHNRRCGLARYTHWLPYHAIPNLPNPND